MASRTIPRQEDSVEYRLFPVLPADLSSADVISHLQQLQEQYLAQLSRLLVGYIWQNEPFRLQVSAGWKDVPPHMYGSTNYGDNVEDEWFIIYLIYKLTSTFPGLVVKLWDSDGEVLLIEAADYLPKWVNPDTAQNRVYISDGSLHLIPQPKTPAELTSLPSGILTITAGVQCVREQAARTKASDKIQRMIQTRIREFPEKLNRMYHHAHCYVPAALAAVLDQDPTLVAHIVQAFYYRDPIDLKSCITMKYFRPGTRVTRRVKLSKCLYAQLSHQNFQPDKRSGFNVLPSSNPNHKANDLGNKLAHGAEILCSRCKSQPSGGELINPANTRWQRFVAALSEKGYFRGEIEGSKLYQKLLSDAKVFFQSAIPSSTSDESKQPGMRMLNILSTARYDIEEMRRQEKTLAPPDDDSWLELNPEQFEAMLQKAAGPQPSQGGSFDMSQMSQSMKAFITKQSGYEGVEIPGHGGDDDDDEVQLDSSSFMQTMQKMFEFEEPADESDSDLDEYGSDENILDEPSSPPAGLGGAASPTSPEGVGDFLGMKDYFKQMDKELAGTNVTKGFEKEKTSTPKAQNEKPTIPLKPSRPSRPPPPNKPTPPFNRPQVPASRPKGLAPTSKPQAPPRPTTKPPSRPAPRASVDEDDIDDLDDDFRPVNVDMNLVKNLMQSYKAQEGRAGPTSNIMGSMGVKMPKEK